MAGAKLIVIYPRPTNTESFERAYQNQHVRMTVEQLAGKTKIVASKIADSPQSAPPFHRIAEIHFPSMDALQGCAASDGKQTIANAVAISSGGAPIFLVAEEETFVFLGE